MYDLSVVSVFDFNFGMQYAGDCLIRCSSNFHFSSWNQFIKLNFSNWTCLGWEIHTKYYFLSASNGRIFILFQKKKYSFQFTGMVEQCLVNNNKLAEYSSLSKMSFDEFRTLSMRLNENIQTKSKIEILIKSYFVQTLCLHRIFAYVLFYV